MYKRVAKDEKSINKDIVSQFTKLEIMTVAGVFGLKVDKMDRGLSMLDSIFGVLAERGMPEELNVDTEKDIELLQQFLVAAEVLDEDGNQIDFLEQECNEEDIEKPDCFGLADDRDVSCRTRCKLLVICQQQRVKNRPPCFKRVVDGFDGNSDDCKICIEAFYCQQV